MSVVKSGKPNIKRNEKNQKLLFPASIKCSELVPINLANAIEFGMKLERHVILGFNSTMRSINKNY